MDGVDMMAAKYASFSPYNANFNNPLHFIDPDGNDAVDAQESKGFQFSDGYSTLDSRNSSGSVGFEGAYQNSGDDPPKKKLSGLERTASFGLGVLNTAGAAATAVYIAGTDGAGAIAGGYAALGYTLDHAATSFTEAYTGEAQETNGSKLLQAAGVSQNTANNAYAAAGLLMLKPTGAAKGGVTVIGEGMARVEAVAAKIPDSKILNTMPKFTGTANQVTSQMMQYNRQWILGELRSGRTILDIGRDATRVNPSIFYQMEQKMIKNYKLLHP